MKNTSLIVFLFFNSVFFSHAQTVRITGTVSDRQYPLPGATIVIKGTTIGTQTDFDGNFSMDVEKGQTLVFSYLGFKTKNKKIKDGERLDITLREHATLCFPPMDYYLPYKIYEFDDYSENWQTTDDIRISLARVPGVQMANTGVFTGNAIRIRGDDNTIVIVDGIRYDASILNTLHPADIESIGVSNNPMAQYHFINQ